MGQWYQSDTMRTLRRRRWVILLAGLALLPACSTAEDPGDALRLQATATRSTLFDTQRTFRLELRNDGDAAVAVTAIQLRSPRFETLAPTARDTQVAPGRRLLLPLPYGSARCDGVEGDPELLVTIRGAEHRIPLAEHPADLLARLNGVECAATAVREAVDLRFGDEWEPVGPRAVRGEIVLTARGEGDVAIVDEVRGNVIFGVRFPTPQTPVLEIDESRPEDRLEVIVSADRCDPHVLIEYKRTFLYVVSIRLDGDDAGLVDLEAEGAARQAFEALLRSCLG